MNQISVHVFSFFSFFFEVIFLQFGDVIGLWASKNIKTDFKKSSSLYCVSMWKTGVTCNNKREKKEKNKSELTS